MNKHYITLFLSLIASGTLYAQDAPTIITQPSDGETVNLYRTTKGYEGQYTGAVACQSTGDWQRLVFGNDGYVYLENPVNSFYSQSWIKGRLTDDNTIEFQLPQAIYSEDDIFSGEKKYGYLNCMHKVTDGNTVTYKPNEAGEAQVLRYTWKDNTLTLQKQADDDIIGVCNDNGAWVSYGEETSTATRVDDNYSQPSATAAVNDGLMLYMGADETSQTYPVKYAFDGDNVYLGDLTTNLHGYWIKGEMKGNTATFPATSLLGIDTKTASYVYVSSGVMGKGVSEVGDEFDKACLSSEPLVFTYDPSENTLSSRQMMFVHKSKDDDRSSNIFDTYRYPLISHWDKVAGRPFPPLITAYMPWDDMFGYAAIEFKLSYYSQDGDNPYLDPANLFYCLYIDGEKVEMTPDNYSRITESMTDVPYSFDDSYDFYKLDDNNRRIYFYTEPKKTIGMEAVYVDGDQRYSSGVTEYTLTDPTGVDVSDVGQKHVEKVEYTDLLGRRVNKPSKGVTVRTVTFSDGTKATTKYIR